LIANGDVEIKYHWVPSHKGVWANEEADMAAKAAAEAPNSQVRKEDRFYSLASLSRDISEWATRERGKFIEKRGGKKFKWNGKKPMNPALKKLPKRDAQVFWQFACGHAIMGDYLKHKLKKTDNDTCWHCNSGQPQTRSHLFERCTAFQKERRLMRADVRGALKEEALRKKKERWEIRVPVRDLFARECLTGAVMDFLRATKCGRMGRPPDE
jgi:hypothetical protein